MLCKKCGAELPDGTETCIFCNAPLNEEEPEENTAENDTVYDENERKRQDQMNKMLEDKKQQLSEIEERRNTKKQKQKKKKVIIICLIVVIAAAAAGAAAYFIKDAVDSRNNNTATPLPTVSPIATPTATIPAETPSPTPTLTPEPGSTLAPAGGTDGTANTAQGGTASAENKSWSSTGNTGSGKTPSSSGTASGSSSKKNSSSASGGSSSGSTSKPAAKTEVTGTPTGISAAAVDSKLATGGKVIYNNTTGRYLMTFVSDGVLYYANVSAGSTTEQINGKKYTVSAAPTGETYDGNTVYEISSLTGYSNSGYIIADSGTRVLTADDIAGFSKEKLALARNEIYARHGRRFKMAVYRDYFNSCSWYKENPNYNYADDNSNLNSTEIKNVKLILQAENN